MGSEPGRSWVRGAGQGPARGDAARPLIIGPGVPIRFAGGKLAAPRPAPAVGQDNALVYGQWLGYGAAELERLRAAGNI